MFDKPMKVVRAPQPRDPVNPDAKAELTCWYYPHFMVKQVDLGEKGADQLSVVPIGTTCKRANVAGEKIVGDAWGGYFSGVKGEFIFFDGDDGWEGGMGFAVFSPDAKKLFDDARAGSFAIEAKGSGAVLRYRRLYRAGCSLFSGGDACWKTIRHDTGLTGAAPGCRADYVREQKRVPKFAKQTADDPTVIAYEVSVAIDRRGGKVTPVGGKAASCRPAE